MSKSQRRHLLVSVVYGGVVVLLLLLAVLFRELSLSVGEAHLAGRFAAFPLFQTRQLDDLDLSWHGMSFRFSRRSTPALTGVQAGEEGTDIVFGDGTRLHLAESGDSSGSFSITPIGSGGASPLVIRFRVSGNLDETGSATAVSWKRAGRGYLLGLPSGARADQSLSQLTLPVRPGAGPITLRPQAVSLAGVVPVRTARAAAQSRLPDTRSMPTPEALRAALDRFADAAYAGWTGERYSDGAWKMPGGGPGFSEGIGVGLLAESIARGTWGTIFPLWTDALARQEKRAPDATLPFATTPYVGGLRDYAAALETSAAARISQARGLLSRSDAALFSIPGLIPLLIDHGSPDLLQGTLTFLTGRSAGGRDLSAACGRLEVLLDYTREVGPNEELSRAARELIDRTIMPAVRSAGSGAFLDGGGSGRVDVGLSIRCGSLLLRAGESLSYPLSSAVGRGLLSSSLGLAADDGTLPLSVMLSSGRVSAREGEQGPESVYSLLPLDRRLPREIPLSRDLGQGAWIWTAARLVSVENTADGGRFVLEYPVGIPHHFMIRGVKPFTAIHMHGIPWHTDPTYAKYSDGWAYDSGSRTLLVKLTGRQPREEIDILY